MCSVETLHRSTIEDGLTGVHSIIGVKCAKLNSDVLKQQKGSNVLSIRILSD